MRSEAGRGRGPAAAAVSAAFAVALAGVLAAQAPAAQAPAAAAGQPVSFRADLSSADRLDAWTLDGNGTWTIRDGLLLLEKAGVPGGTIRRPSALAVLETPPLADATIEVELRS